MKIRFTNLGPIKSGEIDIKPLTIFIGPNNTGKTYSAYCLYGVLDQNWLPFYADHTDLDIYDEFIDQISKRGYVEIDLERIIKENSELLLNDLCKVFTEEIIYRFMQTSKKDIFEAARITVELSYGDLELMLEHLPNVEMSGGIGVAKDKELIAIEKKKKNTNLKIYTKVEDEGDREILIKFLSDREILRKALIANMLTIILGCIRRDIVVLPAERLALVTLYRYLGKRGIKIADLTSEEMFDNADKLKDFIRDIMFISYKYSMPIRDFIAFLDDLTEISMEFESDDKTKEKRKEFIQLSEMIENDILKGRVVLERKEKIATPILEFELDNGKRLELHLTSTAVKELTGLVLYFRYLIDKGDILIIDEPEMNLHPEAQAKLLEIITIAVNKGVKVILTTHSPYIVDHVINLMEGYYIKDKIEENNLDKYLFLGYKESFISPEKVGAYFFSENGEIKDILDFKERLIDWETFSNVSDKINIIYSNILEFRRTSENSNGGKNNAIQ